MTDELRNNLGRLDPLHSGVTTEPPTTTSAKLRMERVMSTSNSNHNSTQRSPSRSWLAATAAIAVVAVAFVGIAALGGGDNNDPETIAAPPLELSLGDGDAMASCMVFDVAILADMPMAFAGTATTVEGDRVTLTVDNWYTGGDAAQVTLIGQTGLEALIAGITFETGGQYLITAFDGNVNYCGYSAKASPELLAAFEEAFGS